MVLCNPETILSQKELYENNGIGMLTASIGFIGAVLQLRSLRQYKNTQRRRPSSNPAIIFYLAVSDLIFCVGAVASAILLMIPGIPNISKNVWVPIDATSEIIMRFGYFASWVWTVCFATDMCFQLYRIECAMVVYHILAWAIPIELVAITEIEKFIHYSYWCAKGPVALLLLHCIIIMVVVVANPVIFCVSYRKVKQLFRSSGRYTNDERAALCIYRRKFFFMVIIFNICWLPYAIFSGLFLWSSETHAVHKSQIRMWSLTSSLTPLQGMFNYFLYRRAFRVIATDTTRGPDLLPRVRRQDSLLDRIRSRMLRSSLRLNQSAQENNATLNQDQETTPLVASQEENENSSSGYVYTCRLLGE